MNGTEASRGGQCKDSSCTLGEGPRDWLEGSLVPPYPNYSLHDGALYYVGKSIRREGTMSPTRSLGPRLARRKRQRWADGHGAGGGGASAPGGEELSASREGEGVHGAWVFNGASELLAIWQGWGYFRVRYLASHLSLSVSPQATQTTVACVGR